MDWTLIVSVLGSVMLATLGYFLNGRQNRTLEKSKTKYHEKLKAYRRMNESFSALRDNLLLLKTYQERSWGEGDLDALKMDTFLMLSHLAIAREHGKMMGSEVLQKVFDEYNEIAETESFESERGGKRLRDWLGSAFVSLMLVRIHLLVRHTEGFERAFLDADILIDNDEIEDAANVLMNSVMADLVKWGEEDPTKAINTQDILGRLNKIGELHKRMRDAMYIDLEETL